MTDLPLRAWPLAAIVVLAAHGCGSPNRPAPRSSPAAHPAPDSAPRAEATEAEAAPSGAIEPASAGVRYCTNRWSITDLIPFNQFGELDGRITAVVWSFGLFGTTEFGAGDDRSYRIAVDGHSPRSLLLVRPGETPDRSRPGTVEIRAGAERVPFAASVAAPDSPNSVGLTGAVHLVDLEVNGGRGGSDTRVVGTQVRVLDGTPGYMSDPSALLARLHARFVEIRRGLGLDLGPEGVPNDPPITRLFLSYSQPDRALTVVFADRRALAGSVRVMGAVPEDLVCLGDTPAARGVGGLMRWGVRFDVAASGEVTTETVHFPH